MAVSTALILSFRLVGLNTLPNEDAPNPKCDRLMPVFPNAVYLMSF